jgi:predicted ArsR family transcriptional regulator
MNDTVTDPTTLARSTDADSSHAAACEMVESGAYAAQMERVLALVRASPGSTSDELAQAGGLARHAAARRLPDLEKRGAIKRGPLRASKVTGRKGLTWWPAVNA